MSGRVLFLIPGLDVGGAERHTIELREALRERGIESDLIVHGRRTSATISGMKGAEGAIQLFIPGMSSLQGWLTIWRELRKHDPTLIVAINQTPLIVSVVTRILRSHNAKIIEIFHTTILRASEESMKFLFFFAVRQTECMVYVSANQERYWSSRRLKGLGTKVIQNGIDLAKFCPNPKSRFNVRERLGVKDAEYLIGIVATLRPEKNHLQLIRAVGVLRSQGLPARLLIVGNGPELDSLIGSANEAGIQDHVFFVGEQQDVRSWICGCDVGVICSTAVETFSLAALEFLSSGVPMVMSNIGGASELITHGVNGYLFEKGDTSALVHYMTILADSAKRKEIASQARCSVERLSIGRMVSEYESLLTTLCAQPRQRWI